MSRGKYCRRKNNAKFTYFITRWNANDQSRPSNHNDFHKINTLQREDYERFLYNHARKNVLEDCITDSEREALIRSGEYRIGPNPDSSYSTNEEVHQCGAATNIGHDAQLTAKQIKTICEQATELCALAFIVALIGIIVCLE